MELDTKLETDTKEARHTPTKEDYATGGNNRVFLAGSISGDPVFSHEVFGEGFYEMNMSIDRLSGAADTIPVTMSERLLTDAKIYVGKQISIKGQFRSYNKLIGERSKLMLTVFAREVEDTVTRDVTSAFKNSPSREGSGENSYAHTNTATLASQSDDGVGSAPNLHTANLTETNPNIIELTGYICKPPIYRTTPFNREICDILVAVNRAYNKSDYIPAIAWGRNARFAKNMLVGEKVHISGRIQSREYQKRLDDGTVETRTAFEVSINKISRDELESHFGENDAAFLSEE